MKRSPPKIALCAAYANGYTLVDFVLREDHPIEFIVTCNKDTSEYEEKIAALCEKKGIPCLRKMDANSPAVIEELKKRSIDLVLLLWWPGIIKGEAIAAATIGWINLHTSLLPYNRGMYPYYWAIVEGTPFGATLHFINEKIDAGAILFQREIPIAITDTGESLYARLMETALDLFKTNYHKITRLDFTPREQEKTKVTFHLAKDIEPHSQIDLEKAYRARELLDIIRARTFWNGNSAYFFKDGKKYWVRIDITEATS